jgi:hypothetical protein
MIITDPNTVANSFTSAFVLDKPKLTRILNVIEDRFKEAGYQFKPEFEVIHANRRQIKLSSMEDLFTLDNTLKNPITNLQVITTGVKREDSDSFELKAMQCSFGFDGDRTRNIRLSVRAEAGPKLAAQIFAELEEQIERTFSKGWVYKYIKGDAGEYLKLLLLGLLSLILIGLSVYLSVLNETVVPQPSNNDIQALIEKSKQAKSIESKVDFLFESEIKRLEMMARQPTPTLDFSQLFNLRNMFIVLPLLIILTCTAYLIGWCYPRVVFLWGDYETYYNDLITRRKSIWSLVILSLVFGIIGNLFVYGLSSYVHIG